MKKTGVIIWLFLTCLVSFAAQASQKNRILVLSDIEAEPDDAQSMVRFLLYANQFDVEGLIATSSIHIPENVYPESIHAIVNAYGAVQPNLLKHERGYPTASSLRSKIKQGLPVYGMKGVGEGKDSEGSEWIIRVLEKPDDRPLYISAWGGTNCLAQALWKISKLKSPEQAQKLFEKVRVYAISDQDDAGPWIRKTFPSIFYIVSPGYNYRNATWRGINLKAPGSNTEVISDQWLAQNIQQGHGKLGTMYPDVAYGMEGDTPAFLWLIPNGLSVPEHPNFGSWGGRYELYIPKFRNSNVGPNMIVGLPEDEPETRAIWTDAEDSIVSPIDNISYKGNQVTIWRWREAFQNDFAARMEWCTKKYKEANHPPVPGLKHSENLTVKSGQTFRLDASATTDPDGDSVSYLWFQYNEAGTYKGNVNFGRSAVNMKSVPVTAPTVDKPENIHFILSVKDKGTPSLTRYKRVIVNVLP